MRWRVTVSWGIRWYRKAVELEQNLERSAEIQQGKCVDRSGGCRVEARAGRKRQAEFVCQDGKALGLVGKLAGLDRVAVAALEPVAAQGQAAIGANLLRRHNLPELRARMRRGEMIRDLDIDRMLRL